MPEQNSNINFAPKNRINLQAGVGEKLFDWTVKSGRKIMVVTATIVLVVFISRFKLDHDFNVIADDIDKNTSIIKNNQDTITEFQKAKLKLKIVETLLSDQIDWAQNLDDFTSMIPQDMTLENLSYTANNIQFSATVKSAEGFSLFIQQLIQNTEIETILLSQSTYDTQTGEYSFSLGIGLKQNGQQ